MLAPWADAEAPRRAAPLHFREDLAAQRRKAGWVDTPRQLRNDDVNACSRKGSNPSYKIVVELGFPIERDIPRDGSRAALRQFLHQPAVQTAQARLLRHRYALKMLFICQGGN